MGAVMNIPPEALEAGARAIADMDCPASLFATCESHHGGCLCRDQARAACLAMLAAWPGMRLGKYRDVAGDNDRIILPLTEKTDG